MSTIQIRDRHVSAEFAIRQVRESVGVREISPAVAVTIASWWQSSGTVGSTLAAFATGCMVDRDALLDDIHATRMTEGYFDQSGSPFARGLMSEDDRTALDMLSTFVNHYREEI